MKISFAHNVYDRPHRLKETIRIEKELFPDATVHVAYNNSTLKFDANDAQFIFFQQPSHKIGCVNGAYYSIKLALMENPDVIIFSHDDVFISNPRLVKFYIDEIVKGKYDFIGRIPKNLPDIGMEYTMMEAMFFSAAGANAVYENFKPYLLEIDIDRDLRGSISPEVNMYNIVRKALPPRRVWHQFYNHGNDPIEYNQILNDTLGFTHENIGKRGWKE